MVNKSHFKVGKIMFKLIENPTSVPIESIEASYKRQNTQIELLKHIHTAFDGIILGNFEHGNIKIPYIKSNSICFFAGSLFQTDLNIILNDENKTNGNRYLALDFDIENKSLEAKIVLSINDYHHFYGASYELGKSTIRKYLNISFLYFNGEYREKSHFKNYDNERIS